MSDINGLVTAKIGLFKDSVPKFQGRHVGVLLEQSGKIGMVFKA